MSRGGPKYPEESVMTQRILIVTDVYPPLIGGVELQMQLLGKKLQQRGHTVAVATAWQVGMPERENDGGISIYRLKGLASRVSWFSGDSKRRHHPPLPDPGTVWGLRRLIHRYQPDVVHAYGWITYSCAVALLGKHIPMLLSVREYGYTCALRTMMRYGRELCQGPAAVKCLDCAASAYGTPKGLAAAIGVWGGRYLLRWKTSGIHSVSTYMQRIIRRDLFGVQDEVLMKNGKLLPDVVIPSFRDDAGEPAPPAATDLQAYLDQLPSEPYILFVGALRLVKGIEPLLRAYRQLVSPPPLVLIGVPAGDRLPPFPPGVTMLPNVPHRAVMAAWERALFGVAPSIWPEPFGSVIHEAMSKGKAVISTSLGGQTDMIVEGITGLFVSPDDTATLANAMQLLIDNVELRRRLGLAGQERARLFTAPVIVPRFEQLYQQLTDDGDGQRGESHPSQMGPY